MTLPDLLRVRRWVVETKPLGFATEIASRHLTEAGATRGKIRLDLTTAGSHLEPHVVRHDPHPIITALGGARVRPARITGRWAA